MPNPALTRLGFSADDRVVVVNADDVGMCAATVDAFFELAESGAVSSGSVMVPCPWFPEVASRCRKAPDLDVGVHLTLTSEWDGYRWAPLSTRDPASGLVDAEGYLHRNQDQWTDVDGGVARAEIEAQLGRAQAAGIDVSHIDSHMFSILHPSVTEPYVDVALSRRLPALMTRQPQWVAALTSAAIGGWEANGLPVFDHLREMPLTGSAGGRVDAVMGMFDELPCGLTYLIAHPANDTPELRAITPDWSHRVADLTTLRDPAVTGHIHRLGIEVIGWRPLKQAME
ncbi:MAG: polysaccharide deacetylase family protein [Acidimicrobiales bacterium]